MLVQILSYYEYYSVTCLHCSCLDFILYLLLILEKCTFLIKIKKENSKKQKVK